MLGAEWKRLRAWLAGTPKNLVRLLLTALLVVPAIAYIGYQTWRNWEQLRLYEWPIRPGLWGLSFLEFSAALFCTLIAWNYLMARLGGSTHFWTNARLYCLSELAKRLPSFIWYMASRALLYRREGVPASVPLAGSALEMALMATSGVLTYFLTLPFAADFLPEGLRLAMVGIFLLLGGTVLQPAVFNRLFGFFLRRLGSEASVKVTYRDVLPVFPIYLLAWWVTGATLHAVASAVYSLPLQALPTVTAIWAASGTLTMLLSSFLLGYGVREVTLSVFLVVLMPQPMAVVVALLFSLLILVGELIWAGILALWR